MTQSSNTRSSLSPAHDGIDSRGLRSRVGHRVRRFLGREQSGSVVTEFAFVLPIFIALVFGTMQIAMVLHADMTLSQAMRDGARFAVVNGKASDTPATKADIKAVARQAAALLDQGQLNVDVVWVPNNFPGSQVIVAGTYIYDFHVPGIGRYPVTLVGSSVLTIHN